jgi:tight adherence protein C
MATDFLVMIAVIFGTLLGLGIVKLEQTLFAGSSTRLLQRVSPHLTGFRAGRSVKNSHWLTLIAEFLASGKMRLSDQASIRTRQEQMLWQLPDFLDLMSVALSAGETLYASMHIVTARARGVLADEFRHTLAAIDMGSSIENELEAMAKRVKVRHVEEFANKVILAQRRGTPMARLFAEHSSSVRAEIRNELLVRAGKNETKMLVPLVFLILPITVLFAVYPSLNLLNFSYQ